MDAVCESITCTAQSRPTAAAATCADCIVPDRCDDRLMHTMPVAPRSIRWRKRASNAPGDGAAVSGRPSKCSTRSQNSAVVSSSWSTNSSDPHRIVSGTTSMTNASTRCAGRSHALSVTTLMPMSESLHARPARQERGEQSEFLYPEQREQREVDRRPGNDAHDAREEGLPEARPADGVPDPPCDAGDRECRDDDARDGRRDAPTVDAVQLAVQHNEADARTDVVGRRERERQSWNAEPRIQRERERDVDRVLHAVDPERCERVEARGEGAQREQVQREREEAD